MQGRRARIERECAWRSNLAGELLFEGHAVDVVGDVDRQWEELPGSARRAVRSACQSARSKSPAARS